MGTIKHVTIGVFGELQNNFLKKLGNKGTINDIEFRNNSGKDYVCTLCSPKSDKVAPLLQAVNLVDIPIMVFDVPSPELGEAMLAVDARRFPLGILCISEKFGEERARNLIMHTSLAAFDILPLDPSRVLDHILSDEFYERIPKPDGATKVPIDNYFSVKSVGTVALGIVKRGNIGVYTKLVVYPTQREVLVKSMQSQDKDIRKAVILQRVGCSLKGVKPDDLKRGNIIAQKDSITVSKNVTFQLVRNSIISDEISVGDSFFVCIGLQTPVGRVKEYDGDIITFELEREIAFDSTDMTIVAKTTLKPPRVIGGGRIKIN
ncbi:MAG: hypothetical protein ACXQS3_06010 [Candidatus Methanofastidiosia archaeon]